VSGSEGGSEGGSECGSGEDGSECSSECGGEGCSDGRLLTNHSVSINSIIVHSVSINSIIVHSVSVLRGRAKVCGCYDQPILSVVTINRCV
jgi:hypothetical protein